MGKNMGLDGTGKLMALLGALIVIGALMLGYRRFALGAALAAFVAWLLYRWQMTAATGSKELAPQKATTRLLAVTLIKTWVYLILLGLSVLGGEAFLFGVLAGLLLQVMTQMGQAFYLVLKKGGTA